MPSTLPYVAVDDPNRLTLDEKAAEGAAHRREQAQLSFTVDKMLQSVGLGRYSVQPEPLMLNAQLLSSPSALVAKMAQLTPVWTLDEKQRMLDEMVRGGIVSNRFAAQCLVELGTPSAMTESTTGKLHTRTTLDEHLSKVVRSKRVSKTRSK